MGGWGVVKYCSASYAINDPTLPPDEQVWKAIFVASFTVLDHCYCFSKGGACSSDCLEKNLFRMMFSLKLLLLGFAPRQIGAQSFNDNRVAKAVAGAGG